jgi:hypothetical protein
LAEIVNLRRARKQRRRQESKAQATIARSLAGETKSAKIARRRAGAALTQHLDGHRLSRERREDEP